MAARVISDLLTGASWNEKRGLVDRIYRRVVVDDLDPNLNADSLMGDALSTVGVPQPQEVHPTFSSMLVYARKTKGRSPTQVEIDVEYRPLSYGSGIVVPPPPGIWYSVRVYSDLIDVETDKKRNESTGKVTNTQITVKHNDLTVGGPVRVRIPRPGLQIGGKITGSLTAYTTIGDMTEFRRLYQGKANSAGWYGDPSSPAKRWLMTSMDIDLEGQTDSDPAYPIWSVVMTFESYEEDEVDDGDYGGENQGPCDPQAIFIDPNTNKPGRGLVKHVGYKWVYWYQTADFNAAINALDGGPGGAGAGIQGGGPPFPVPPPNPGQ